jgi:hypothetical protein
MKIIDRTPFYKEKGELSLIDRGKAFMQFGTSWFKEVEAQKSVIAVLGKALDKNFTILVNVIPPGLDARIPLILVGPTGVYVMSVTPLKGMFRAKGDQWGTISGNTFRPAKPNLLTRTERMARAIHVFLQRQGYSDLNGVEAILLSSDPTANIDSMRPIIRVVMRDALERFAVSVAQGRIVMNPESAYDIVNRLLNPPTPAPSNPVEPVGAEAAPAFTETPAPPVPVAEGGTPLLSAVASPRPRRGLTGKQMGLLIGMFVIWCIIVLVFAFIIVRNTNPQLFLLK